MTRLRQCFAVFDRGLSHADLPPTSSRLVLFEGFSSSPHLGHIPIIPFLGTRRWKRRIFLRFLWVHSQVSRMDSNPPFRVGPNKIRRLLNRHLISVSTIRPRVLSYWLAVMGPDVTLLPKDRDGQI
jgi:hypothetical protein